MNDTTYDAELTRWLISSTIPGRYGKVCATGEVHNQKIPRFQDGDIINTSPIENIDLVNMIITTRNTRYKLVV